MGKHMEQLGNRMEQVETQGTKRVKNGEQRCKNGEQGCMKRRTREGQKVNNGEEEGETVTKVGKRDQGEKNMGENT